MNSMASSIIAPISAKNVSTNSPVEENDLQDFLGYGSARRQREYETYMSNTAYQRAVQDIKQAGLNPAMLYGAGGEPASTPYGGSSNTGKGIGAILGIASIFSNTAKVMKQVYDIKTDKALAINAIELSNRIGFRK